MRTQAKYRASRQQATRRDAREAEEQQLDALHDAELRLIDRDAGLYNYEARASLTAAC